MPGVEIAFSSMQLKSLHYPGNHTVRARIVRIQVRGQAQVIREQLRENNFERSSQIVRQVRCHGRNEIVAKFAI
jgi:hypothetical protein